MPVATAISTATSVPVVTAASVSVVTATSVPVVTVAVASEPAPASPPYYCMTDSYIFHYNITIIKIATKNELMRVISSFLM